MDAEQMASEGDGASDLGLEIAIIGFSNRFPGANDPRRFWENLVGARESLTWFGPEPGASGRDGEGPHHVAASFVVDDAECFDAAFFSMSPREAALTDPQHRVLMECAYAALEHAGHADCRAEDVGVYMGCGPNTYLLRNILTNRKACADATHMQILIANEKDYLANRISYKLDLRGPSVVVQSACSTSLLAVHVAARALFAGECDMALAGGVSIGFPQDAGYQFQQGSILSPDGHCRPFDADSAGTVPGNGAGVFVLRRLAEAIEDGDTIYAVIRGTATNNDGAAKVGYAAPSIEGQARVIETALDVAGVQPGSVGYVESHGTGTALGDPVEVAALAQAYRRQGGQPAVLGAVKSNVGHLDAAAGAAGLLKAVLSLHEESIPPSLHFEAPNPAIDFDNAGFNVNASAVSWPRGGEPRRSAVSSFGIGGSNVHVVLEEAPLAPLRAPCLREARILRLSALSAAGLAESARRLAEHLDSVPDLRIDDIAHTLSTGRRNFTHRLALVADSADDAARILRQNSAAEVFRAKASETEPRVVFMFPGQGTQHADMARSLFEANGVFARTLRDCCDRLQPILGLDLLDLLYPADDACEHAEARLAETWITQPALFAIEFSLARQWIAWGVKPEAMIGHSVGEYVAACLADVLDLGDALRLVAARGRLMQSMAPGAMLAVNLPADALREALPESGLCLAAVNRPQVCVLSGPHDAIETMRACLSARDVESQVLATSHAFHSAMMDPCCAAFEAEVATVALRTPKIPFVSSMTGDWIKDEEAVSPAYWARALRQAVLFVPGVETLAKSGPQLFLECGPGRSLSSAIRDIANGRAGFAQMTLLPPKELVLDADAQRERVRAQLWCNGLSIDERSEPDARKVALPTYPFERKRHWIEARALPTSLDGADVGAGEDADDQSADAIATADMTPADRLAMLWCNALGIDTVGHDDNFFALGGDSILSIQIAHNARSLGIGLKPRMLVEYPTIASVIAALEASGELTVGDDAAMEQGDDPAAIAAALVHRPDEAHEPFPLTDIQHAYWLGRNTQVGPSSIAAHAYEEFECETLDVDRLQAALRGMIAHHPMMRAVITPDGRQRVLPEVPEYEIAVRDYGAFSGDEAEAALRAFRGEKSHQVMDCERWPLFEVSVTRMPDGRSRLHVSFDLLITDAWSITIFWLELERRYRDPEYVAPAAGVSFRDYVLTEIALESGAAYQRARDYWLSRVDDFPDAPTLPMLCAPDQLPEIRFVRREARVSADVWKRLKQRASEHGMTPSVVMCAAYAETLAAWCETPRFCLNLPAFSRLPVHPQIGEVMGDFTSVLLLEADCSGNRVFRDVAHALQARLWDDISALQFSGVKLVRAIAANRAVRPTMPYVFTSLIFPGVANRQVVGTLGRLVEGISQTPQVWLDCQVYEDGADLMINWDSIQGLYSPAMLDRMFEEYIALVHALAEDDAFWTSTGWRDARAERLIGPARREANDTARTTLEPLMHVPFLQKRQATPDAVAVIAEGVKATYAQIDIASRRIAAGLRDRGAAAGDRIAIVLEKGWEQIAAVVGVVRAGMTFVPVDPALPYERVRTLCGIADIAHAVTTPSLRDSLRWPDDVMSLAIDEAILRDGDGDCDWRDVPVDPDSLAYIIFTSGTTGVPKGVMTTHRAASNTIEDLNERFSVLPSDRIIGLSSLSFDLSVYDIFGALAAGAAVVLPPAAYARDPACWERLVRDEGVTIWNSVPALVDLMVSHVELHAAPPLDSLRLVMMSGDWIPLTLPPRLRTVAPAAMQVSLGGATEASIWSIFHVIDGIDPAWRSVPYGRALANQTFEVLDAELRPRPESVAGELFIGGIGLAEGYVGNPDETAHRFLPDPRGEGRLYRTGDMGRWLSDGTIEFLGRKDSQVKINGFRVEIGEIEKVACDLDGVAACAVVLIVDGNGAKRLVAYACAKKDEHLDPERLIAHLAEHLPAYMVPSTAIALDEMPLSSNGKIDRKRLPSPDLSRESKAQAGPATPTERAIHALWAEIVGRTGFGVTETFFETGGDSRQVTELVTRVRTRLASGFPLRAAFQSPTVREMSRIVDESQGSAAGDQEAVSGPVAASVREPSVPLTAAQARLWFHDMLHPGNSTYNIIEPFSLEGPLDADALREAFLAFAMRHDALSMSFRDDGAMPRQVRESIHPIEFTEVDAPKGEAALVARRAIDEQAVMPFDLREGPLLRVRLLRHDATRHTLVVAAHHIVWDGWSTAIMIREVGALYRERVHGTPSNLPELPLGYADVALWEQAQTQSGRFGPQVEYWRRQLAMPLPVLALPVEGIASDAEGPIGGERVDFTIDHEAARRFREVCQANGASIFMGYLAVWKLLLQWWCRQHDIIVGVPSGHRGYPQLGSTVGFLVNSLAIRTVIPADVAFSELLRSVRTTALEAYANQDVPFDQVVEAVRPARRAGESAPVYRSWFVLHDVAMPDWGLPDVRADLLEARFLLSVHDIKLSLVEKASGMDGGIDFRTGLFGRATIERLADCFRALVQSLADAPEERLAAINRGLQDTWDRGGGKDDPPASRGSWNAVRTRRVAVKQA